MVHVDPISAPGSTFGDAARNRTGLCSFEIFHEICLFCLQRKAKCCLLPRIFFQKIDFLQFFPPMFGKFLKKSPENGNGDSSDPVFRSFFDRDPPHGDLGPGWEMERSWGIPKEFSSSNYKTEQDRADFSKSRIRRLVPLADPPLQHREQGVQETWVIVVFPDFADLGGGIRTENRRKKLPRKFHDGAR